MAVIITSDRKLHDTCILGQRTHVRLLCIPRRFKANANTKHLLPCSNNLCSFHRRFNKGVQNVLTPIKLLELGAHVTSIYQEERMAHKQISTMFKKWDLLVTLEGKYV